MEINEKEKRILETLENGDILPTTKISFLSRLNYYETEIILEELMKLKLIKKIKKNSATYWSITKLGGGTLNEIQDNSS